VNGCVRCRILSSTFLHDSFVHLASSCYALGTIAPAVERALGPLTFLATYLLSGAAGSIATFAFVDSVTVRRTSGSARPASCSASARRWS
jgi:membrane associated rhomboid family serine protease